MADPLLTALICETKSIAVYDGILKPSLESVIFDITVIFDGLRVDVKFESGRLNGHLISGRLALIR